MRSRLGAGAAAAAMVTLVHIRARRHLGISTVRKFRFMRCWQFGADRDGATETIPLREDQWERIWDLLPGQEGHRGVTAADNRSFPEVALYRYRAGGAIA